MQPEHDHDLAAVQREAFNMIGRGVADRRHAFHTPVLVTHGIDGFLAARTVVLRGFDATERVLVFHSDRRSRKVAELAADPRIAAVFYELKNKIQVRVDGWASVHVVDGVTAAAWQRLAVFSRRGYLSLPPGSASSAPSSGLPAALETRVPDAEEAEGGYANFAVILAQVHRLD
jgi:pyridoxine/pyridoxamine 5'-phosphate oxidase